MGRLMEGKVKVLLDKIVELARKVYEELKPFGFANEKDYEVALAYEFRKNGLKYLEQMQVDIMYGEQYVIRRGEIDFLVFDEKEEVGILVELKLASGVEGSNIDQAIKYYKSIKYNSHFPSFISDKIVGGIILVWDKDPDILYDIFEDKIHNEYASSEQVDYSGHRDDIEIIQISVDQGQQVSGSKGKRR